MAAGKSRKRVIQRAVESLESRLLMAGIPPEWTSTDIGIPPVAGSASYDTVANRFTVRGSGLDIWDTSDQFNFASRPMEGDGSIIARVDTMTNTNPWAKSGVMIRASESANAPFADVVATSANSVHFQWRPTAGAQAQSISVNGLVSTPIWVKLDRNGNNVAGSYSYNGAYWYQIGTGETVGLGATALAGLAVTSTSSSSLNTSTFSRVSVTPVGFLNSDIGSPSTAGSADFNGETWTVRGAGNVIGGTSDRFNFLQDEYVGDLAFVAKVESASSLANSKVGLMLRDGTAANSPFVSIYLTPTRAGFDYRSTVGGATTAAASVNGVSSPGWIKVVRVGNSFSGYYSSDGSTWTQAGASVTLNFSKTLNIGLAVNSGNDDDLNTATLSNVSVGPVTWTSGNIGAQDEAGSALFDGLNWTVRGGGSGITGTTDEFNFARRTYAGNATIVARLDSLNNTGSSAKAGLMIRDGAGVNAKFVYVYTDPDGGVTVDYRATDGGATQTAGTVGNVSAPAYLRLSRTGATFKAFYSYDNYSWTQIGGDATVSMRTVINVGMAVTANNASAVNAARFSHVWVADVPVDPYLKQNGRHMRNAHGNGDIVPLRGVNIGGWLMNEPWIGPMDNSGLPDHMRIYDKLTERFGVAGRTRAEHAYQDTFITAADLDAIKEMGYNNIRVPFWYLNMIEKDGTWRSDAFTHLDWIINEAYKRGIYTVIDFHGLPGGQNGWMSGGYAQGGSGAYWWSDWNKQKAADIWQAVATHYRGNPAVASYDLVNEPAGSPSTDALWSMYNWLFWVVRGADPDHNIQVEGNWGWDSLPQPWTMGWTNVSYHTHAYAFGPNGEYNPTTAQVMGAADHAINQFNDYAWYNIPLYIGEFSGNYDTYALTYQAQRFKDNGISWAHWTWKSKLGDNNPWTNFVANNGVWIPNLQTDSLNTILQAYSTQTSLNNFHLNPMTRNGLGMPQPYEDTYNVVAGQPLYVAPAAGVLKNDTTPNAGEPGISLRTILVNGPSHGTVQLWDDGSFTYTPAAGFSGTDSFRYKVDDNHMDSTNIAAVNLIVLPQPKVTVADFNWRKNPSLLTVRFDTDVSASLAGANMILQNLTAAGSVPVPNPSYNSTTNIATFSLTNLADGNYRFTIPAGAVVEPGGQPMGSNFTLDFFMLAGDANHDRRVDTTDFNALAGSFGSAEAVFSQGDLNYDGTINSNDFGILVSQYGKTLPAPIAVPPLQSAGPSSSPFGNIGVDDTNDPTTSVLA